MARKPAKTIESEQVNLRLSAELLEKLDRIVERTGVRRTHHISQAILEYVLRFDRDHVEQQAKQTRH